MRRIAARMTGFTLIALGFAVSMMNAYVFGVAEGRKIASSGADVSRVRFIQNSTVGAFLGGVVIFVIGHVPLLSKYLGKADSAPR